MKVVDDISVGMPVAAICNALVPVRMAGRQAFMRMLDDLRITGGPKPCCRDGCPGDQGEDDGGRG